MDENIEEEYKEDIIKPLLVKHGQMPNV